MTILIFRYIAQFLNGNTSKAIVIENRGQILHFLPPPP